MDIIQDCISQYNGITLGQLCHKLDMKNHTVSSRLTGLKHRGLIANGYNKWFDAVNVIELDNNQIEVTLHNGNIEVWDI